MIKASFCTCLQFDLTSFANPPLLAPGAFRDTIEFTIDKCSGTELFRVAMGNGIHQNGGGTDQFC